MNFETFRYGQIYNFFFPVIDHAFIDVAERTSLIQGREYFLLKVYSFTFYVWAYDAF